MGREIAPGKRLEVARLYFQGLSYDDISKRSGVAKGSVAAVVEELREGKFPQLQHVADLATELRELAVGLRKAGIAPAEATLLFILVKRLIALGVEPAHLEPWVRMSQSVPEGDLPRSQIIQAATKLAKIEGEGLSYEEAIEKLTGALAELKQVEEKVRTLRSEEAGLDERSNSLKQACLGLDQGKGRLEAAAKKLEEKAQGLAGRCQKLEKEAEERQATLSGLDEKLPRLQEQAQMLEKEVADRTDALRALDEVGFSSGDLGKLRAVLGEIGARHGNEELATRFFGGVESYDSLLGMEAARQSLAVEVETLTRQRDALVRLAEQSGLAPDEVAQGIAAMKDLRRKGVSPSAIVSYQRLLNGGRTDPQSFEKVVGQFSGVEQTLAVRRRELEKQEQELAAKERALQELKKEEAVVKVSIATLRESAVKEMVDTAGSAAAAVEKLCQALRQDITRWGDVRAEMGKCQEELKLARYFGRLPLSPEALYNLVDEIGPPVVMQYLTVVLTWCRKKFNPRLRPPTVIAKKYYTISEYTEVELTDVVTWALLALIEGVGRDQG